MITQYRTMPGKSYLLRATAPTTISCLIAGELHPIATASNEQEVYFTASTASVQVETQGDYVIQELFSPAPFIAGGGGGFSPFESGLLQLKPIPDDMELNGGIMYTITADEALDLSGLTLPAEADECATCELALDYPAAAMVLWSESWSWCNGNNVSGNAPTLEAGKRYFFAIRTVMGETVINHYLTSDL